MEEQAAQPQLPRSTLVTVLAWITIVMAGFSTLIAVLQSVMVNALFAFVELPDLAPPGAEPVPPFFRFMFEHVRLLVLMFLVVSGVSFLTGIGLLWRKNWARLVFVLLLGLGILWNIAGVALQRIFFSSMPPLPSDAPPQFEVLLSRMTSVIFVFAIIIALAISVLFGWLIARLLSRPIRAEFLNVPQLSVRGDCGPVPPLPRG